MITLNVDGFCHNCPDFEAVAEKTHYSHFNLDYCETRNYTDTVVVCKHLDRCRSQMDYLRQQKHKEDSKNV